MTIKFLLIAVLGCCFAEASLAEQPDEDEQIITDFDQELGEQEIDVQGSIEDAVEVRGFRLDGDLRLGYVFAGEDLQDVSFGETDILRARWRVKSSWGIASGLRASLRLAGLCSTEDCTPDFILQPELPTRASIKDGQVTVDALFLQWFRSDRFDVAVGRIETKFVARGGVFSKSLDRNDSNNLRVNWTDGIHSTFKAKNGWESHLILQYNSSDGPSNVRRDPLDFSAGKSRVSTFLGFENLQARRGLIQRALDITYMPASLLADGQSGGQVDDYWAFVARAAARWPLRSDSWRLRFSSEIGYAPNTPTKSAAGVVGTGDADGLAWNVTASIMDFLPDHSIGLNYAITEAGWLISPQYADNERLYEIRYMWRPTNRLTLDTRGRWRDELHQRIVDDPGRDRFDFYARVTWSFEIRGF